MINIFEKHFWVPILVNQYETCFGCNPASGISLKNCCLLGRPSHDMQAIVSICAITLANQEKKRLPWVDIAHAKVPIGHPEFILIDLTELILIF